MNYGTKIVCPKCNWEPDGGKYWGCSSCGQVWDTFTTAAVCPSCKNRHEYTQCIPSQGGCNQSSPHVDWYKELDRLLKEELEKIKEVVEI